MFNKIPRILTVVALGLATSVIVAWCGAYTTNRYDAHVERHERSKVYFDDDDWHSAVTITSAVGDIVRVDYFKGDVLRDRHATPDDLPQWTMTRHEPDVVHRSVRRDRSLQEEAWGWPMRSLRSAVWFDEMSGEPEVIGGINLGWEVARSGIPFYEYVPMMVRSLPLRPIALGFLVNLILYGGLWFILLTSMRHTKRWNRMRRGWCPRCRYDLRHAHEAGCPECGWNR